MKKYRAVISVFIIVFMVLMGLPIMASTLPGNDNFSEAFIITGGSGNTTGHNVGATSEDQEPVQYGSNSVWWSWTAPSAGSYAFDTFGSDFDTVLQVFTGTSVSELTQIVVNDDAPSVVQSAVTFEASAGTTYMICVRGYDNESIGDITLTWLKWNDDFINAIAIGGMSGITSGHNLGATPEEGDPLTDFLGATVWWSWTAPQSGYVAFNVDSHQADPVIGVCIGSELGALSLIGFNEDLSLDWDSRTTFQATENVTYHIIIDSHSAYGAPFSLQWSYIDEASIPANDNFSDGFVIAGESGTSSRNNVFATREIGEPEHLYLSFSSVWWSWTAPADGTYYWDTEGSVPLDETYKNDYMNISVYTGVAVDELTLVTRGSYGDAITFNAVAGITYHIAVDSDYSSFWSIGDIVLNWGKGAVATFTSADLLSTQVGTAVNYEVTADGYPEPYVWKYSGILPDGLLFTPGYGCAVISGTPQPGTVGTYILNLEAWNYYGRVYQSFTLTVTEPPTITSGNSTTFNVGSNATFKVATTGYPAPTVSLTSGSLPAGVTFNETTATLSGIPDAGTAGTYELIFTADNGVAPAASQNFTLIVLNQHKPLITADPQDAAVVLGDPATFRVEFSANPQAYIQWQYSTDGARWKDIAGANSDTYTTPATKRNMNGYLYRVVLSNAFGMTISEQAKLIVMSSSFATVDLEISQEYGVYDPATKIISWVIHVTNLGGETAKDVVVTDSLVRGTKYAGSYGIDSIPNATISVRGSTVNVNLGEMAAGDSVVFTILAEVTRATSPVENTAEVKTTSYDSTMTNNISQAVCTF